MGCGSTSKKTLKKFDSKLKSGNFQEALKIAEGKSFYKEKRDRLLKLMEIGTLLFLQKKNFQSLQYFDEARELSNDLFTKSISKKAKAIVGNDQLDNFYGEIFERSLIRYYSILNNLLLSQKEFYWKGSSVSKLNEKQVKEKELEKSEDNKNVSDQKKVILEEKVKIDSKMKKRFLGAARALSSEWYSKNEGWKQENLGSDVFKDDVLARVLGGFSHEFQRDKGEMAIAKNLYREGERILFRNYNIFNTFNLKAKEFRKNFSKLSKYTLAKVKNDFTKESIEYKNLNGLLKELGKSSQKRKKGEGKVFLNIESGFIGAKQTKKYYFPLGIGSRIRTLLRGKSSPTDFLFQTLSITKWKGQPAIAFELPTIKVPSKPESFSVKVYKGEKLITEKSLTLVNPLSEIAKVTLESKYNGIKARLGARLAVKYTAAIISAVTAYKRAVKNGTPKGVAELMAAGLFAVASKGIEFSEAADLRSWRSLPNAVYSGILNLPKGNYDIELLKEGAKGPVTINRHKFKLDDQFLFFHRSI